MTVFMNYPHRVPEKRGRKRKENDDSADIKSETTPEKSTFMLNYSMNCFLF